MPRPGSNLEVDKPATLAYSLCPVQRTLADRYTTMRRICAPDRRHATIEYEGQLPVGLEAGVGVLGTIIGRRVFRLSVENYVSRKRQRSSASTSEVFMGACLLLMPVLDVEMQQTHQHPLSQTGVALTPQRPIWPLGR
jgi:hypothetical protein